MARQGKASRKTNETTIQVAVDLDGNGKANLSTGIGFFDHMLDQLARHGGWDLSVQAEGDLHIDPHHTVEDVGIVLGQALREAIGDARGIQRFADVQIPLEEALAQVVVDICGRPFLSYDAPILTPTTGDYPSELTSDFLRALCNNAGLTMHIRLISGENQHHVTEVVYKGVARALRLALQEDIAAAGSVPSTKGVL